MSRLIDELPDAITLICFANLSYHLYPKLELVSLSWKSAFRSAELFRLRQELGLSEDFLAVCCHSDRTWQLYDPVHKLWTTLTKFPLNVKCTHFGVVSSSQKLFVIGGQTGFGDVTITTNEVWSFDLITRTWSMLTPMLMPRAFFACCVVDGNIVVAGGFTVNRFKCTLKAEMYDIKKDVWSPLPDLIWHTSNRYCHGLMIGGQMHVDSYPRAQVFDSLELKWRYLDYGWLPNEKTVVRGLLYSKVLVPHKGYTIVKHNEQEEQVISSPRDFSGPGMRMIGFRDELYIIRGSLGHNLSDVHVLNVRDENPTWNYASPMNGLVFGWTELII